MKRLLNGLVLGYLVLALVVTGCTRLVEEEPTPTPLPTPADANKPVYEVRRGSIVETIKALGRVAAKEEATLYFRQSGRLRRLYVELNQKVKKDDILAELETGTLLNDLEKAKINYEIAQLKLQQAVEKAKTGQTAALKEAAARVASAEAALAKAQADYERLQAGTAPSDLAAAEAAVAEAAAALRTAEAKLADLRARPKPEEVQAAEKTVEQARNALWAAQINRDAVCSRDRGAACQAENARVAAAETAVQQALIRLEQARQPARPEEIQAAEETVRKERARYESAQARLDQLRAGPKAADRESARQAVESARAALESARAAYAAKLAEAASTVADIEVQIQRRQVELARLALQALEEQVELARIRAPFDGTVMQTNGREGDQIQAYTPVIVLANPRELEIAVELNQQDLPKVALGQEATVTLDVFKGQSLKEKVVSLPSMSGQPQPTSTARTIRISFNPPGPGAELGMLANVVIVTQKKENTLLVPTSAVRRFGGRKYVQIVTESGRKREVDVETGIVTDTDTEILKGLKEGMKVVGQ